MMIYISRLPKNDDWDQFGDGVARKFVKNFLFNDNILRQGWGYPGYDLRQTKDAWIKYVKANYIGKDNQSTKTDEGAKKRYSILQPMLDVKPGDIIIIPNISRSSLFDRKVYTVAITRDRYYFEDRSSKPDGYEMDFGHCIPVKEIQCIEQSTFSINFQVYQKAFNRVRSQYIYDGIDEYYL